MSTPYNPGTPKGMKIVKAHNNTLTVKVESFREPGTEHTVNLNLGTHVHSCTCDDYMRRVLPEAVATSQYPNARTSLSCKHGRAADERYCG